MISSDADHSHEFSILEYGINQARPVWIAVRRAEHAFAEQI